ncbi:MAG TPA: class I tRNA ligase family protein [Candidatus Limnocylindria bacterium]|nr:class I tRNA ligase family protein [Candidatus Limnocylindria bacterium]
MLRLYDTRRRAVAPVRARGRDFTMYVCGVTPYDTTHLGHARTFLVFDVVARLLEATGHPVRYVQNVTDIDESILQRAARDGVGWRELGTREERAYLADMKRLGWRRPDVVCHATQELPAMFALIRALERRRAAYTLTRGVYFPVAAHRRYGELSRLSPAAMHRILAGQDDAPLEDPARRDPRDFALWRFVDAGPTWPSAWGRGRPGWHLECSAMIRHHLGDRIDLHGGGSDLIYPHHENEIAQSETATGLRPFARTWTHVAPMQLGGRKMSKSDGNMIFVRDALKTTDPRALRWYLLERHYRTPFDHDEALLDRARLRQRALADVLGRARSARSGATPTPAPRARRSRPIWTCRARSRSSSGRRREPTRRPARRSAPWPGSSGWPSSARAARTAR